MVMAKHRQKTVTVKKTAELLQQFNGPLRFGKHSPICVQSVSYTHLVCNMGQNGREIPAAAPTFPAGTDLLIVMLGINNLLQGQSPEQAAERLERFLAAIPLDLSLIHI